MEVKPWARSVGVPASSVFGAIAVGRIGRGPDGTMDVADAEAWLRSRKDRIDQDQAAESGRDRARQRELDAWAAQAATEIVTLRRQLDELRTGTVAADTAEAVRGRRRLRLQAALAAMPALHAAAVAEAVSRPPPAVSRVLATLVARVTRDLGEPAA